MTQLLKNFKKVVFSISDGIQSFRTYKRGKVK